MQELWTKETNDYKSRFNDSSDDVYLIQDLELDAIAFAHKMMLEHFNVKTIIPKAINNLIKTKI